MITSTASAEAVRIAATKADQARREAERVNTAFINSLPQPGRHKAFAPKVDDYMVVQLPGESMRCVVERIVSPDAVIVRIVSVPMAKSHNFRFDQTVGVRRRVINGRDVWEGQNDREFLAEQARINPTPVKEAAKTKAKPKSKPKPKPVKKPVKKKGKG